MPRVLPFSSSRQLQICSLISFAIAVASVFAFPALLLAQDGEATKPPFTKETTQPSLDELKVLGAKGSSYLNQERRTAEDGTPTPKLEIFRKHIAPILEKTCFECHGADTQEGDVRIDKLNPDLVRGPDVERWLEVLSVLTNGEMPPDDGPELSEVDRSAVIEWLSSEVQVASRVRRAEEGHSAFRRMTRYEYGYALQDLLGLPLDFARDLPPEARSEDGFQNSSDLLHMSATQLETYRESARKALLHATVRGETPPARLHWSVSMDEAAAREWAQQDQDLEKLQKKHAKEPDKLEQELKKREAGLRNAVKGPHYMQRSTGRIARASWHYEGARYAFAPHKLAPRREEAEQAPQLLDASDSVAILPPGKALIIEVGDQIPEQGSVRVRVRASRIDAVSDRVPSLQLEFGWQASNDSRAAVRISERDQAVEAAPGEARLYEWDLPLSEIYPRNGVRGISKMGDLPSPSEFIQIVNSAVEVGHVQVEHVEITAPVYATWPPASHTRIFFASPNEASEPVYAREVLERFMTRAWRRAVLASEVEQKVALFAAVRPTCEDFQEAMIEVLATVLASPHFLYLVRAAPLRDAGDAGGASARLTDVELATRLSMFLWCSTPDDEVLALAAKGELSKPEVLSRQVARMLADPRARRFSKHFVRQWLGLQLLDYFEADRKVHPGFGVSLKEAMQQEPIAFFEELLQGNRSVLDFLHADFAMVNERLARHYGLKNVRGNDMRRVALAPGDRRGGLLTQAGLLAMNSDGKDSHPLKRGIWLLVSLLDDPPAPPPPNVPEIDLADPEIAKMTLKQRIENHRNQAACMSCHAKIDPWGIAFESYDAVGKWRTTVQGKPVDASSVLFNKQKLDGMHGLKRFLLEGRQDQFVRALVHKMATFALGRPLRFGDRMSVDRIAADLRQQGDGLATLVTRIARSDLFQSR